MLMLSLEAGPGLPLSLPSSVPVRIRRRGTIAASGGAGDSSGSEEPTPLPPPAPVPLGRFRRLANSLPPALSRLPPLLRPGHYGSLPRLPFRRKEAGGTGAGPPAGGQPASATGAPPSIPPGQTLFDGVHTHTATSNGNGAGKPPRGPFRLLRGDGGGRGGYPRRRGGSGGGGGGGWRRVLANLLLELAGRLAQLRELLAAALVRSLGAVDRWHTRVAAGAVGTLLLLSGLLNLLVVPLVNSELLPGWLAAAEAALGRRLEVTGGIHTLSLTGLLGLAPLLSTGPVTLGPGAAERSHLHAPQGLQLYFDPLPSLVYRQLLLRLQAVDLALHLVQGENFSWFGFPEDTTGPAGPGGPSARQFLPGLAASSSSSSSSSRQADAAGSNSSSSSTAEAQAALQARKSSHAAASSSSSRQPLDPAAVTARIRQQVVHELLRGNYLRLQTAGPAPPGPPQGGLVPKQAPASPTIASQVAAAAAPAQPPPLFALHAITLRNASLYAHITGERLPRRIDYINADCDFGKGYDWVDLRIEGQATQRPAASAKCTMVSAAAKRHLRHITPGAATRRMRAFTCDNLPAHCSGHQAASGSCADAEPALGASPAAVAEGAAGAQAVHAPAGGQQRQQQPQAEPYQRITRYKRSRAKRNAAGEGPAGDGAAAAAATGTTPAPPETTTLKTFGLVQEPQAESAASSSSGDGGTLSVRVFCRGLSDMATHWPDLAVSITGQGLHGPLIERVVELPMDIYTGRVDGTLRLAAHNAASWEFPELFGRIACRDVDLHFWDAPDDILDADMELLFERDRMYLHGAKGAFGGIPLRVTGDMDLNPDAGAVYRLSSTVEPCVEVSTLRATLGIRPLPHSAAGGLRGVAHCTGPLEKPVFSGTVHGVRPSGAVLEGTEETAAKAALAGEPRAVGAFDKVPLVAAGAVFSLDLGTEMFTLHSAHATPVGGGQAMGSGRMWVAPAAERHPGAISMRVEAAGLDADLLATYYLPPDFGMPAQMRMGPMGLSGSMEGSHLSPTIAMHFEAPESALAGSATFRQTSIALAAEAPAFKVAATMHTSVPNFERFRTAATQAEASRFARPRFEGCDLDLSLAGADLMPLAMACGAKVTPGGAGAAAGAGGSGDGGGPMLAGQPMRLRVQGATRLALRHADSGSASASQQEGQAGSPRAGKARGSSSSSSRGAASSASASDSPRAAQITSTSSSSSALFIGPFQLEALRLNQLDLAGMMQGAITMSPHKIKISAKGAPAAGSQAPAELLELELALPEDVPQALLLMPSPAPLPAPAAPAPPPSGSGVAARAARTAAAASRRAASPQLEAADSRFLLRHGQLTLAADVYGGGQEIHSRVERLVLDDLEAGSLRGLLSSASLDADMAHRQGRACMELEAPRYSSLQAAGFRGSLRWEGDILKLEDTVLEQQGSVYELQGELLLPQGVGVSGPMPVGLALVEGMLPPMADPMTGAQSAPQAQAQQAQQPATATAGAQAAPLAMLDTSEPNAGRWRLQINVPDAEIEDILPAAQLLSSMRQPGKDVAATKRAFLAALDKVVLQAQSLAAQVEALNAEAAGAAMAADGVALASRPGALPGLQDLDGAWRGRMEAYGNLDGPSTIDFNLRGSQWRWGQYALDRVVAIGAVDTCDGIALEEASLTSGPAHLSLRGSLLSAQQDASLVIRDLPLALLQPMLDALPLLRSRPYGMMGRKPPPPAYLGPFAGLAKRLEATLANLGLSAGGGGTDSSASGELLALPGPAQPLNGILYATGNLGGSISRPTARLDVRLEQGCLGSTALGAAHAALQLNERQRLRVDVEVSPASGPGALKLEGSVVVPHLAARPGRAAGLGPAWLEEEEGGGASPGMYTGPELPKAVQKEQEIDMSLHISDGGMALVSALVPGGTQWTGGSATVDVRLRGQLASPTLSGTALVSRASLSSPGLKHPVSNLSAIIKVDGSGLKVETIDARLGRHGSLRIRGALPMKPVTGGGALAAAALNTLSSLTGHGAPSSAAAGKQGQGLVMDISHLDLRLRNVYTGKLDAHVVVSGAVMAPQLGGSLRFSKGTLNLFPQQAQPAGPGGAAAMAGEGSSSSSGNAGGSGSSPGSNMMSQAFSMLAGKGKPWGVAASGGSAAGGDAAGSAVAAASALHNVLRLNGLSIELGPDLRGQIPLMLNVLLSGAVSLSGPADPGKLAASGTVLLENGYLNLVATQFVLDREHVNRLVFVPDQGPAGGPDPVVDLVLVSGDLRAAVAGRASSWQDSLQLSTSGTRLAVPGQQQGGGGGPAPFIGQALGSSEAARMLEERLAEALLAENGQLALAHLASSTLSSLLPKYEGAGQFGKAWRWRLVGAPNLMGLLALADDNQDDANKLLNLAVGAEVVIEYGNVLSASMVQKPMQDGDLIGAEVTFTFQLTRNIRLQAIVAPFRSLRPTVLLQYSSEAGDKR